MTSPDDRNPYAPGHASAYTPTPAYPVSPTPQQPYPYGPPPAGWQPAGPPPRPVSKRLAFWTSGQGVVCVFLIAGAIIFIAAVLVNRLSGPAPDNFSVKMDSCTGTAGSLPTAEVGFTITNISKQAHSAVVHITYTDADGSRLDTDTSLVRSLRPGETARQNESTLLDGSPTGLISCRITGVS